MTKKSRRLENEIRHFSEMDHIWWGARTVAGQRRYDNKFKIFKKYWRPNKKTKILEVGCGNGEFTKRLSKLSSRVEAIDLTAKVIKRAKQEFSKKYKNVNFKVDNIEKLFFGEESFDIVCDISILHHVNTKKAFEEMFRVLKKGGEIFFTEPNIINPNIFLGLTIPFLRKKMEFSPDETALLKWEIKRMLKDIGFNRIKVLNYDFLHPLTPKKLIPFAQSASDFLEKLPLFKEISGSLIIYAKK